MVWAWSLQPEEAAPHPPGGAISHCSQRLRSSVRARDCELMPGHKRNLLSNGLNWRGQLRRLALVFKVQDVDFSSSTYRISRSARSHLSSGVLPKDPDSYLFPTPNTHTGAGPSSGLGSSLNTPPPITQIGTHPVGPALRIRSLGLYDWP